MKIEVARIGFVRVALAAAISAAIHPLAYAQQKSDGAKSLEEVVVTAQFRQQNVQDTPLAITAVSAEMMEARNLTTIDEIARQAPSVSLQAGAALFGPSVQAYIRGVGQFDFNPAFEPGVGMYVDDVYYATLTGAQFDLLDLDRVEVLRGPQGTLTGRNSIGGAIKLFTRKPDGVPGGFGEFTYGARDLLSVRGGLSFALADNLFVRLAGVHKEQDGFVNLVDYGCANPGNPEGITAYAANGHCTTDKLGEDGYTALRGQMRYQADSWSLDLSLDKTKMDQTSPASILYQTNNENFRCGDKCTYADYRKLAEGIKFNFANITPADATDQSPNQTYDGWGLGANLSVDLSKSLNLTSITSYREYQSTWDSDDDWTPQSNGAGGNNDLDHEFFSQEVRLNAQLSDDLSLTVGAYYSDQKTTYWSRQDIRYIIPGVALQFLQDDPVNADSKAVFASVIYNVSDRMTVTAGIRYTDETKDYEFHRREYDWVTPSWLLGSLDGLVAKYSGDEMDYRLSIDYDLTDDVMVYATYATGFKGGGTTPRPFDAIQAINGSFGPETMDSYEIGSKMDLVDGVLRLNTALYYYFYDDRQQPLGDCSSLGSNAPCGAWQNAGDGEAWGFESELAWMPIEGMNIDASVSYYDYEWQKIDPSVGTAVNKDDPAIWVPDWQWSIGAQYEIKLAGGSTITPRIDASYTDKRLMGRATGTASFVDSYTLYNARIAWKNAEQDLTIALAIKNLTDQDYDLYIWNAVQAFSGTSAIQIGEEREWSLSVKKNF